jgi:hypothetical protein
LLFTYSTDLPPYDVTFHYYTQNIVEGATLRIDRVTIRSSDGAEIDLTVQMNNRVMIPERDEMWYLQDHALVKKPCLHARWKAQNCITWQGNFTLMVTGELRQGHRVLEPFDISLNCSTYHEKHYFARWWWWIVSNAG